jgi:tetrahydromethanopterin S-methyltransferase subunit G
VGGVKAPDVKVKVEWTETATKQEIGKAFDKGIAYGFVAGCVWTWMLWVIFEQAAKK